MSLTGWQALYQDSTLNQFALMDTILAFLTMASNINSLLMPWKTKLCGLILHLTFTCWCDTNRTSFSGRFCSSFTRINPSLLALNRVKFWPIHLDSKHINFNDHCNLSLGERLPYQQDRDAHRKLQEEPLWGNKILACEHGLKFLSPLRGTTVKTTHCFL